MGDVVRWPEVCEGFVDLVVIPPLYCTSDVVNESEIMKIPGSWGERRLKKISLIEEG